MNSLSAVVAKEFTFHAAHHLPNHNGKCRNQHGHTYQVRVECRGEIRRVDPAAPDSGEGMVIDFNELKAVWKEIEPALDHQDLNNTLPVERTTAELIAHYLFLEFRAKLDTIGVRVTVWETPTSYAQVGAL